MAGGSALRRKIARKIRKEGPISFFEFMGMALYDPELGYYATRVPGAGTGYRTSPTLTPLFGELIGRALGRFWEAFGSPSGFTVVEIGAGRGDLALAVAGGVPNEMRPGLSWRFVEPFEAVRAIQERRLEESGLSVEWVSSLEEGSAIAGCVLANEVLDNFPVRSFEVAEGKVVEVMVDVEGERLMSRLDDPADEVPGLQRIASDLSVGDRFEIRPGFEEWCRKVAPSLVRGYLLVIDYGDTAPDLWIKRPSGTIMTYRGEAIGEDPLENPGEVDITGHVDFSRLQEAARSSGLTPVRTMTQRQFLRQLGIAEMDSEIRRAQKLANDEARHSDALSFLAERGRLQTLSAIGGMGDFLVFIAAKEAPSPRFVDLSQDC